MLIDLLGKRCPAHGNEPRQWQAQEGRKVDDRWVAEQVLQKGLNSLETIRTAEIEQHDGELHVLLLTRATNCATCASGVSGRTPWPRLKINGVSRVSSRILSTARSKASPPAIKAMGSRLP